MVYLVIGYGPENGEEMTEEEISLADQAADDFASHRFQSEEY